MKTCPDCNGDGVVDKDTDDERQCPTCGGLGFVPDDDDDHEEVIKTSRDLPRQRARRGPSPQGITLHQRDHTYVMVTALPSVTGSPHPEPEKPRPSFPVRGFSMPRHPRTNR